MNRQQIEARKRALVAESEAYRETLRLELAQLQLHAAQWRRRFQLVAIVPTALALLPMLIRLFRPRQAQEKPKTGAMELLRAALAGWRVARRLAPLVGSLLQHTRPSRFAKQHRQSPSDD